jgi:hypothetical protein
MWIQVGSGRVNLYPESEQVKALSIAILIILLAWLCVSKISIEIRSGKT